MECLVQYTINDDLVRIFQLMPLAVLSKDEFQKFDSLNVFDNVAVGRRKFTEADIARMYAVAREARG